MLCTIIPTIHSRKLGFPLCARQIYITRDVQELIAWGQNTSNLIVFISLCLNATFGILYKMLNLLRQVEEVSSQR